MDIKVLSSEVVDQIAAGEVVERPSHLLKELIENSLDAGAAQIEIDVDEGGKKIRIRDDGHGIHQEDLPLVCARHATSKISQADDLWKLHTFGFRGEALASISSVSRLKITSRRRDQNQAFAILNEFGKGGKPLPSGREEGTTIEVEELFANVPARLKFLKSDSAEVTQIKNVVKALALAHFDVEFKLRVLSKVVLFYPREISLLARSKKVLEVSDLFFTNREFQGMKLEIVYSSPQTTTGNSKQIWIFVQDRWVTDRTIQAAVLEAYRSLLMHGEFPFAVIQLIVPEGTVDVNIHPTKSQVKFVDSSQIFKFVHSALRSEIEKAPWIKTLDKTQTQLETQNFSSLNFDREANTQSLSFSSSVFEQTQYQKKDFSLDALRDAGESLQKSNLEILDQPISHFSSANEIDDRKISFWSKLQVLGQSHLTYILAEGENSFFMIDQHAAHERVVFERLMDLWKNGQFDVQNFLLPISIEMNSESVEHMIGLTSEFEKLGVSLEKAGPETLLISSSPSFITETGLVKALSKFADEISSLGGSFSFEKKISDIFATMACHSVVRAGQALSLEEMKKLLEQMDDYRLSSYCPHGRNVFLEIPFTKIEKDFGRLL